MNIPIPEAQLYEGLAAFFVTLIVVATMMKIPFVGKLLLFISALLAISLTAVFGFDGLAIILRHAANNLPPSSSAALIGTAAALKVAIFMHLLERSRNRRGR